MPNDSSSKETQEVQSQTNNVKDFLLHNAVIKKDYRAIELIANNNRTDFNTKNSNGQTAFELAYSKYDQKALRIFLECYDKTLNVELVFDILSLESFKSIHQAAYLYLIGNVPVEKLESFIDKIDFNYYDSQFKSASEIATTIAILNDRQDTLEWLATKKLIHPNAKLIAASLGRSDILKTMIRPTDEGGLGLADPHPNGFRPLDALEAVSLVVASGNVAALHELINPKEEGGLNLPMHIGIFKAEDHLFTAAQHGRIDMLRELVRPHSEGGKFGLSINTKDHNGGDLVLSAVMGDQVEMLRELIKPVAQGGFGLSLNTRDIIGFTPVSLAVRLGKIRILNELIKPISQGGFGLSFNVKNALRNNSDDLEVLKFIFRYQLRQLGSGKLGNALSWLEDNRKLINQHKELKEMCLAFMKSVLRHVYARETVNYAEVNLIKEVISKFTGDPDEADFVIAKLLAEQGDFIRSFLQYEGIVRRNNSPRQHEAEFEMADLIYRGEIILFDDHSINFAASGSRQPATLQQAIELEQLREKESKNLQVMHQRARHVDELLSGNQLPQAAFLRARCEEIFKGNLSPVLSENTGIKRNQDVLQPNEKEHQVGFFKKQRKESEESPNTSKTLEM
ncbi:Ankyrin repeats (3 copies) [Legionella quinlivanii]|uniref:Ankyrin repeats (3 copies) n=1 Tax=Legionella quinlivanii TaxID=45073 RepID=A0A0W0XTF5_9GAMM|nr:ankyrin repeat domain-containing protein [Legionella quinlivanii]KTD47883.1 Ankyrin repeats (3 copies) [Legionella quinlivanii]SEG37386.1 hypothetical protein SAMN02746093_02710 [Legionella quinlivanii DSM 21216]STY10123.1 Ankyrin repeats (3 copies) [Legionella quinlivanii]